MKIVIADDERNLREALCSFFRSEGFECIEAADGMAAKAVLESEAVDAVVADLRMPGMDGLGLLAWLRDHGPSIPAIMISAHGDVGDAVAAMKLGAVDYLQKPFDPEELAIRLRKAVRERLMTAERETELKISAGKNEFLGRSKPVADVLRLIEKAAPLPSTVLITGESGTGKEVAARSLHELSGRQGPFVPINLGALPESLAESELFGYEKGAFTGADSRKPGFFELAHGGTLFLDEIGELPLNLQVKLLRAVQERKISRLGGGKAIPVDARIVAATNRNLEQEVREGRFREDLYYRINVVRIQLPPLRDRGQDIALLANHFVKKISAETGKTVDGISEAAMAELLGYGFPGNVRELQNVIERAVILSEGAMLESGDFSFFGERASSPGAVTGTEPVSLAELERAAIVAALKRNGFRREKTANELGITRRTLLNKIKEYGIPAQESDEPAS
ncbi:MAG: sigma-54 dependent transcriptional regulator [Spirochaetes bacterium]|nr:sigma-54 dependent transcriptional regulator [Spirochaetota bacterium]